MRYLFSRAGLKLLEPYLRQKTLIVFDFDGTLAPLVANHLRAALPAPTSRLLRQLALHAPVALLSGRSRADLKSRSPFALVAWVGNHGIEGVPTGTQQAKKSLGIVAGWHHSLTDSLHEVPGASLESKRYSLTLHYRMSPNRIAAKRKLLTLVDKLCPPPEILPGKCVLNLLVPGQMHKGTALLALLERHRYSRAIFVGDDETDENVFRMNDPRILSVRVGRRRASVAQCYLKNQREANALLRLLLKSFPLASR